MTQELRTYEELRAAVRGIRRVAKWNSPRCELANLAKELGYEHNDAWLIADEIAADAEQEDLP